jgi:hypothetical protein
MSTQNTNAEERHITATSEQSLQGFLREFVGYVKGLANQRILSKEVLQNYNKAGLGLHGMLQSSLVVAGHNVGWVPVIEPRIPLKVPLNPSEYGKRGKRKRHYFRADVGYYRGGRMDIFAECCTTDEAVDCFPSSEIRRRGGWWISKRDALLHFIQNSQHPVSAMVICVVLPRQMKKKPSHAWARGVGANFFDEFSSGWEEATEELQRHISVSFGCSRGNWHPC